MRTVRRVVWPFVLVMIVSASVHTHAQAPLTLAEAIARARADTPEAQALAAAANGAEARVREARAPYWPRVDFTEGAQRGDQPVFVFSSLLAQRRFTAADFAVDRLNHPSPITNTRTAITIAQSLFDGGSTRLAVAAARVSRELAAANRAGASQDLAMRAAQAFVDVLQRDAAAKASTAAVAAAESDRTRAQARRELGLATDADTLALDVHLADMRQRQIADEGRAAIARLELNRAVGASLDDAFTLAPPPLPGSAADAAALVREALTSRPEIRSADLRVQLADNGRSAASAALLPRVGVQGGWEMNGDRWADQQSSWIVGADVQINLFRGFGDAARIAGAREAVRQAEAERAAVRRAIELEVRTAASRLDAARAGAVAGRMARAEAEAAQRIVRDRYDNGVATVTDVLRAAQAVLDAESRATTADMDVILQSVALDRAVGRL